METIQRYQRLRLEIPLNHELENRCSLEICSWKETGGSGQTAGSTGSSIQLMPPAPSQKNMSKAGKLDDSRQRIRPFIFNLVIIFPSHY